MKRKIIGGVLLIGLLGLIVSVYRKEKPKPNNWQSHLPNICSFSSPRPVDLNQDGILDIVFGAGADEFQGCDSAIVALNGLDGSLLWHVAGRDQMVGSPVFSNIDQDSVLDVIISGRAGQLMAISGKTGSLLWCFYSEADFAQYPDSVFLNFYGPQLIPDVDQDGHPELLVAYGGDATIPKHDPNRPTGQLVVVSSTTGKALAQSSMPDGAETYMTPVCADLNNDGNLTIIFGSGGETLNGHLYRVPLSELLNNNLSAATELVAGEQRGFIAPPAVVDITGDGTLDIVTNAVDGRIIAIDGVTNAKIWQVKVPQAEVYGSLSVGNFTGDATPDFFTNVGRGIFPEVAQSIQLMVDGRTGEISYLDSLGFLQIGSPLVADMDNDGWDEAIMSVNWYDPQLTQDHYYSLYGITNELLVFNFREDTQERLLGTFRGVNPAATPWLGDLDNDQQMDVIYTYITDTVHYQPFNGMKVIRKEIGTSPEAVRWGSYMGSSYNGILRDQTDL